MSYIPKYIIKRMIPMDAVKAVEGGIEINVINVISPISIDDVPDNVIDYLEVSIDGVALSADLKKKIVLSTGTKSYNITNAKSLQGETIPVGAAIKIFAPVTTVKKGEEHTVDVTIKTNNPMNINVTRTIQ